MTRFKPEPHIISVQEHDMNSVNLIGCYFSQAGRKVDLLHFLSLFVEFIGGNKSLKKFIHVVFFI